MAPELGDRRFKSTSNIVNDVTNLEDNSQENSSTKNRFRTYTFKDLRQEKKHFTENTVHERKKSRNLIRRLIGSLEKKNEECKADDEFVTRYYRRNDRSLPIFDHSFDGKQNPNLNDLVSTKQTVTQSNRRNGQLSKCCNADNNVEQLVSSRRNIDLIDSQRFPSTAEEIFESTKEEESFEWSKKSSKKRLDRKRSFKDFLGFMIKWKRPSAKETPHRFVSCDHLADKTKTFSVKKKDRKLLSRTSSLSAVDSCQTVLTQSKKPKATINSVYNGRRNEQILEVLTRNKENWEVPILERTVEDLEKSAIRRHSEIFFPTRGPRR